MQANAATFEVTAKSRLCPNAVGILGDDQGSDDAGTSIGVTDCTAEK